MVDFVGMDVYDDDLDYNNPQGYGTNVSVTRQQRWQQICLGIIPDQRLSWLTAFASSPSMRSMVNGSPASGVVVAPILPLKIGMPLIIADAANPSQRFLEAVVTSYVGGDLEVDSFSFKGTGYLNTVTIRTHPSAIAPKSLAAIRQGT